MPPVKDINYDHRRQERQPQHPAGIEGAILGYCLDGVTRITQSGNRQFIQMVPARDRGLSVGMDCLLEDAATAATKRPTPSLQSWWRNILRPPRQSAPSQAD
jgi:hypothetical protein